MKQTLFYVLLVAMFIGAGCRKQPYSHLTDRALPVEIEVVGTSSQQVRDSYIGEIRAMAEIPLVFPLGGQITGIYVKSGDRLRKGDVIATVDDTQAKSLNETAKAMLAQAEDGYARLKPLHESGGISDVKWVEMETNLEKARSMAISAAKRLEDCTMRASQDGVVNLKSIEVGMHIGYAQSIGSLMDVSFMCAEFMVSEGEIGKLQNGQSVSIEVPAISKTYMAKIREKALIATHLAHTYRVAADITTAEASKDLLPGMVCRASIVDRENSGFIISSGCIQTQQRGHSVWVLRNCRAERVMVKIADFVENGVLISEGLQHGDTVISKGYQKMFNGAKVSF